MKQAVKIALDWAVRCFGIEHVENPKIRALRLAEEAIELAQACGLEEEQVVALARLVYSRPPGTIDQELGGVLMTANVMCAGRGADPDEVFLRELLRVLAKSPEEFAARNANKPMGGQHDRDRRDTQRRRRRHQAVVRQGQPAGADQGRPHREGHAAARLRAPGRGRQGPRQRPDHLPAGHRLRRGHLRVHHRGLRPGDRGRGRQGGGEE